MDRDQLIHDLLPEACHESSTATGDDEAIGQHSPTLLLFLQGVGVEETELTWKHSRSRTGAREVIFPSRLRARNGL
jgi:hypothetical protein